MFDDFLWHWGPGGSILYSFCGPHEAPEATWGQKWSQKASRATAQDPRVVRGLDFKKNGVPLDFTLDGNFQVRS